MADFRGVQRHTPGVCLLIVSGPRPHDQQELANKKPKRLDLGDIEITVVVAEGSTGFEEFVEDGGVELKQDWLEILWQIDKRDGMSERLQEDAGLGRSIDFLTGRGEPSTEAWNARRASANATLPVRGFAVEKELSPFTEALRLLVRCMGVLESGLMI